jgi:hypothetical protein
MGIISENLDCNGSEKTVDMGIRSRHSIKKRTCNAHPISPRNTAPMVFPSVGLTVILAEEAREEGAEGRRPT